MPIDDVMDRVAAELVAGRSRRKSAERAGVSEGAVSYLLERDSFRERLGRHAASAGIDLAELPAVSGHPRLQRIVEPILRWLFKLVFSVIAWAVIGFFVLAIAAMFMLPFVDKTDWVP